MNAKEAITQEISDQARLQMIGKAKARKMIDYLETDSGIEYLNAAEEKGTSVPDCVNAIQYLV